MLNEFALILIVYPIIVLLISLAGYFLAKNVFIMPAAILIVSLVMTYTVYNASFLIWAAGYTLLSFIVGAAGIGVKRYFAIKRIR